MQRLPGDVEARSGADRSRVGMTNIGERKPENVVSVETANLDVHAAAPAPCVEERLRRDRNGKKIYKVVPSIDMAVPPVIQSYEGIRHTLEEGRLLPHVACHLAFVYPVAECGSPQVAGDIVKAYPPVPVVVR